MSELIVFENDAYIKLRAEQMRMFKQLIIEAKLEVARLSSQNQDMLPLREAQKILPYRSKTKWQSLRDNGEVEFSQFGRKILYSKISLQEYIKKNKIK